MVVTQRKRICHTKIKKSIVYDDNNRILKIFIFLLLNLFLNDISLQADGIRSSSLYSYSGYLTTPSAYIIDGQLGFHYSYLPKQVSAIRRNVSDNKIYSACLGFFPFMELYFSVIITPSAKWIYNYGSFKTRSPGVKLKIFDERKSIPTISFGIYDPDIHKLGGDFTSGHVSSTFVVISKKLGVRQSSVSIGYGFKALNGKNARLNGLFGGINMLLLKKIFLLVDYDSEYWSEGINFGCHGFDIIITFVDNSFPAYRIGYNFNLFSIK